MSKNIIMEAHQHQTRVAVTEDGDLVEIYIERLGKERIVGNIYKGIVQNVLPGMQAAFVDIGLEKNAFLYAGDILVDESDFEFPEHGKVNVDLGGMKIRDMIVKGQEIVVQVLKEPIGTKGVRVTTHITLPGRMLVLMPTVNYVGVSRRIPDEKERIRLKELLEEIKPEHMGVIVRTAASGKKAEDFMAEIDLLTRLWNRLQQKSKMVSAPRLIHSEESLVYRAVRDMLTDDVDALYIDDNEYFQRVTIVADLIAPKQAEKIRHFDKHFDIFDYFELESKIEKALSKKVWLKSGGYIIIDQTEALTVIDVNTGKYVGNSSFDDTALQTNLEAAAEIARQLRLRDISGIIIVDFIDMNDKESKYKVLYALKTELLKDRTKSNVVGMTGLGLVEMTRKKIRPQLSASIFCSCPECNGEGMLLSKETIALKIRKELNRCIHNMEYEAYLIETHADIYALILKEYEEAFKTIHGIDGKKVYIKPRDGKSMDKFKVSGINDAKVMDDCINRLI